MDEVAFVESLFSPEMRSATTTAAAYHPSSSFSSPLPSACGRVKVLMGEQPPFSNSASPVPPPPNSLLGGGIALVSQQLQAPFQPVPSEDTSLFVRLHDDEMFTQMLHDHDFGDYHTTHGHHHQQPHQTLKKEQDCAGKSCPSTTNALLLEPLELSRSHGDEECSKDTIENHLMPFQHTLRSSGSLRNGCTSSSTIQSMNGYTFDSNMMSVIPPPSLGPTPPVYFGTADFTTLPPNSHAWIQEDQPSVSTPDTVTYQRAQTMKHMVTMPSVGMLAQHPSPGSVDMLSSVTTNCQHPSYPELWISTSRNALLDISFIGERRKQSLDTSKMPVERSPLSLTISPPASLTDKAFKELIVFADFGTPTTSRQKRARKGTSHHDKENRRAETARTMSASPVDHTIKATAKSTKGKKCIEAGCTRRAQSNSRCKAHGGGARCQYAGPGGCIRSSQGGGFCRAHGGGKRCEFPGCTRGQQRKGRCYVHGGIRKCQHGTCEKKDRGNGFCISHGGGKRCDHPNCSRAVRRGLYCQIHEMQPTLEKEQEEMVML